MYNPFYIFYTADHYCENIRSPSTLGGVGRSVFKKILIHVNLCLISVPTLFCSLITSEKAGLSEVIRNSSREALR